MTFDHMDYEERGLSDAGGALCSSCGERVASRVIVFPLERGETGFLVCGATLCTWGAVETAAELARHE